jgi:hypothetical protein
MASAPMKPLISSSLMALGSDGMASDAVVWRRQANNENRRPPPWNSG